jgi:hypothetical protein
VFAAEKRKVWRLEVEPQSPVSQNGVYEVSINRIIRSIPRLLATTTHDNNVLQNKNSLKSLNTYALRNFVRFRSDY